MSVRPRVPKIFALFLTVAFCAEVVVRDTAYGLAPEPKFTETHRSDAQIEVVTQSIVRVIEDDLSQNRPGHLDPDVLSRVVEEKVLPWCAANGISFQWMDPRARQQDGTLLLSCRINALPFSITCNRTAGTVEVVRGLPSAQGAYEQGESAEPSGRSVPHLTGDPEAVFAQLKALQVDPGVIFTDFDNTLIRQSSPVIWALEQVKEAAVNRRLGEGIRLFLVSGKKALSYLRKHDLNSTFKLYAGSPEYLLDRTAGKLTVNPSFLRVVDTLKRQRGTDRIEVVIISRNAYNLIEPFLERDDVRDLFRRTGIVVRAVIANEMAQENGQIGEGLLNAQTVIDHRTKPAYIPGGTVFITDRPEGNGLIRTDEFTSLDGHEERGLMVLTPSAARKRVAEDILPDGSVFSDGFIARGMTPIQRARIVAACRGDPLDRHDPVLRDDIAAIDALTRDESLMRDDRLRLIADSLGLSLDEIVARISRARDDLTGAGGREKSLGQFSAMVDDGQHYCLGVATQELLGFSRELLEILPQGLRREYLFHEALCAYFPGEEGHQTVRRIQMVLFTRNYGDRAEEEGDRLTGTDALSGDLTVALRRLIDQWDMVDALDVRINTIVNERLRRGEDLARILHDGGRITPHLVQILTRLEQEEADLTIERARLRGVPMVRHSSRERMMTVYGSDLDRYGVAQTDEARAAAVDLYQEALNRFVARAEEYAGVKVRLLYGSLVADPVRWGVFGPEPFAAVKAALASKHLALPAQTLDPWAMPSDIDLYVTAHGSADELVRARAWVEEVSREVFDEFGVFVQTHENAPDGPSLPVREVLGDGLRRRSLAGESAELAMVHLPPGFEPDRTVELSLLIADIDRTVTPGGTEPVQGENLEKIIQCLLDDKDVILISGSPYHPEYAGLDFSRESIRRRVVDVIREELRARGAVEKMERLRIRYISGKGTVTFTRTGEEQVSEETEKILSNDVQISVARAFVGAFCSLAKGISPDEYRSSSFAEEIAAADDLGGLERIAQVQAGIDDIRFWPFGSELALICHDPHAPAGADVQRLGQQFLSDAGIDLPEETFFFSGGPAFTKVAVIRKRDVIEEEIARVQPQGAVLALGDSNTDDFLLLQPQGVVYLPVYLGPAADVGEVQRVIVARNDAGQDNVKETGFSVSVGSLLEGERSGVTYRDLPIFSGGKYSLRQLVEEQGARIAVAGESAETAGSVVTPDRVVAFLREIEADYMDRLYEVFQDRYPRCCHLSSEALAQLLSVQFGLPVGGDAPERIVIQDGRWHGADEVEEYSPSHRWLAVYYDGKPAIFIDATLGQFYGNFYRTLVIGEYSRSLEEYRLAEERVPAVDVRNMDYEVTENREAISRLVEHIIPMFLPSAGTVNMNVIKESRDAPLPAA